MHDQPKTASMLTPGCRLYTPARRWETVTRIQRSDDDVLAVTTDQCAIGYTWTMPGTRPVTAEYPDHQPEVRLWETGTPSRQRILAGICCAASDVRSTHATSVLVTAEKVTNRGWRIHHRPIGTTTMTTVPVDDKRAARYMVRQLAHGHAEGMRLPYCEIPEGHDHHDRETPR